MTQDQWDAMSNQEKYDFLGEQELCTERKAGMNPRAKVGAKDAAIVAYVAVYGKVVMSSYCDTAEEAIKEAMANREALLHDKESK